MKLGQVCPDCGWEYELPIDTWPAEGTLRAIHAGKDIEVGIPGHSLPDDPDTTCEGPSFVRLEVL